jgi:putative MATE family efflux protein
MRPFAVTNRSVLAIAIPMTLAYLTTPMLGLVDTAVVGQLGDAALLGGLAAGALVFDVVFTTFNFLRSGTTGLVAQAYGRGDELEEQAVFWRAFAIAVVVGVVLAAAAPLVVMGGIWFMDAEAGVDAALDEYVRIRLLGAPFALINYAILGYVLGRGEGGLGLILQLVLNGINIALSILFGLWLGWGVAGVAWGTVAGELVAMLLGLAIVIARFKKSPRLPRERLLHAEPFWAMVSLNRDIMIRSFSLLAAFALFTRQGAQFGTLTLAANAVLMNFFMVSGFFLDGFATAAEQLAGRAVGARPVCVPADRVADVDVGLRAGRRRQRRLHAWRARPDRADHHGRGRPGHSRSLSSLGRIHRRQRRACLPDGRRVHRRDLVDGHAQHDAAGARRVRGRHADADRAVRQSRPVGGAAHLFDLQRFQPAGDPEIAASHLPLMPKRT